MIWIKTFLPFLATLLTGVKRYPVKLSLDWNNWSHSILNLYEFIFWRRHGIRPGGLTWYQDSTGKRKVWVTTWFGFLQFLEHEIIRPALRWNLELKYIKVHVPAFAGSNLAFGNLTSPYLFAIAFEEAEGAATGTSTTPNLANVEGAGTDPILIGHFNYAAASWVTTPAFPVLTAMTQISSTVNTADGNPNIDTWRLVNPQTSAATMIGTLSASVFWVVLGTTYTGVDQATPTADEDSNVGGPYDIGTPVTLSNTSNLDGSWQILSAKQDSGGTSYTVDSPAQLRQGEDASPTNMLADGATAIDNLSNGSIAVNWTGGTQKMGYQSCMIRAAAGAVATGSAQAGFMSLIGVGN